MAKKNLTNELSNTPEGKSFRYLHEFIKEFWGELNTDPYIDNWHIEYICAVLQQYALMIVKRQDIPKDLIINVPPSSSKSTIVSQMFPIWLWLHAPWAVIITTSYNYTLAKEHSVKSKTIFKSDKYQNWFRPIFTRMYGKEMKLVTDTDADWQNSFGGRRFSTGTGGTVTGVHGHIIIRDDPLNTKDAMSEAILERTRYFNDTVLPTRKKHAVKTPTITVMQRLRENDTSGLDLQKTNPPRLIKIPATSDGDVQPPELRKFYKDGYMEPVRLGQKALDAFREALGSYHYAGQMMQEPFPDEGGKVKREWFQYIDSLLVPIGLKWDLWIDGAYTDKTENDPTGLMVTAYDKSTGRMYVKHATSKHMELPQLLNYLPEYCDTLGINGSIYIEPKASGHSIYQFLLQNPALNPVLITGNIVGTGKEHRIQTAAPKIESGRVYVVEGNWNSEYVDQIAFFPNATHDEYVDLIGYAVNKYFIQGASDALKVTVR